MKLGKKKKDSRPPDWLFMPTWQTGNNVLPEYEHTPFSTYNIHSYDTFVLFALQSGVKEVKGRSPSMVPYSMADTGIFKGGVRVTVNYKNVVHSRRFFPSPRISILRMRVCHILNVQPSLRTDIGSTVKYWSL